MDFGRAANILLCLRYGIGDLVMETAAFDALRAAAGTARITGLGARPAIELLEADPAIDELVCVQDLGFGHWGDQGDAHSRARLEAWLDARGFDIVLDPSHAVIAVRDLLWARGGVLLDTGLGLQEKALAELGEGIGAIRQAVREGWGLPVAAETRPRVYLDGGDRAFAREYLRARGIHDAPFGVSPVASSPLKRWPVERLAATADRLAADSGRQVLIFGGPQSGCARALHEGMRRPQAAHVVEPLPLRRTAALLERCAGLVGNDTGLMHLAAALETPVVGVFGPTSPAIYMPPGQVPVSAATECPHRKTWGFGPSECLVQSMCFLGIGSCIQTVPEAAVTAAAHRHFALEHAAAGPPPDAEEFDHVHAGDRTQPYTEPE